MESNITSPNQGDGTSVTAWSSTENPGNWSSEGGADGMWEENFFSQAAGPACAMVVGYVTTFTKLKHFENPNNFQTLGPRLFTSLYFFGAVTGIPVTGCLIETYGRERPLIGTAIFMTLTWIFSILVTSGTEVWPAIIRFILGVVSGAFALILPIYMVESSELSRRGRRGCYYISDSVVGALIGYAVYTWIKKPWIRTLVNYIILAQLIQIFMGAESPHFKARDMTTDLVAALSSLTEWKIVGICTILFVLQEVNVAHPMSEYFPKILCNLINSNLRVGHGQVILLALQFIGVGVACLTVDQIGRRPLLLVSMSLLTVSSFLYGIFLFFVKDEENINQVKETDGDSRITTSRTTVISLWLGLVSTVIFFVGLTLGIRPIAYLTMAELLPMKGKGFMGTIIIFLNFVISYVIQVHTEIWRLEEGPSKLYWKVWICTIISGVGGIFVFFTVPEMCGREFLNFE